MHNENDTILAIEATFMPLLGHYESKPILGIECDSRYCKHFGLDEPVYENGHYVFVSLDWIGWTAYHLDTDGHTILSLLLPYYLDGHYVLN